MHEFAERALPAINASLNGLAGTLLFLGWLAIRRRNVGVHWRLMVAAMSCSALFLVGYVLRMSLTWTHRFEGPPGLRAVYLVILTTHMILAACTVPLVARTAFLAVKGRLEEHRRIARITFPVWMYVSVTGVVIYFMLYHLSSE